MFNTNSNATNGLPAKSGPTPFSTPNSAPSAAPGAAPGLPPRNANSPFEKSATATSGTSVIGTDLTILGDRITIISANKLQVDGDVRGNVHGKQVVITEEGSVVGMVCAEAIEVRGGVRGSIRAVTVKLQASAHVEGDITHQKLSIAEGAEFDGRVRLCKDVNELIPVLDPEVIERGRIHGEADHIPAGTHASENTN